MEPHAQPKTMEPHTYVIALLAIQELRVKHVNNYLKDKFQQNFFQTLYILVNPCYNNPCLNGATCQVSKPINLLYLL